MPGQWRDSTRRQRLPANWSRLRRDALRRCGGQCQVPGCRNPASDVDHIVAGNDHRPDNLQGLCTVHHRAKSSREGVAARRATRSRLRRPPQQHPGLAS